MNLYVNGEKLDVTLENEKTVGDVLQAFEKYCEQNKMATIGIKLNGKDIPAPEFDSAAQTPLCDDTEISLTVVSETAIQKSFSAIGKTFSDIEKKVEQIPIDLQSGKDAETNKTIIILADALDQFCHIATLSTLFPETYGNVKISGKSIANFFSDFSHILSEFKQAMETGDTVSIGDLAEYEICPRLHSIAEFTGAEHA